MSIDPIRRSILLVLAGGLAGCLTPPVRPQYAMRGRHPVDPDIATEIDRVGDVFRVALRRGFGSASDDEVATWISSLPQADQSVAVEAVAMAITFLQRATTAGRSWESLSAALGPEHAVGLALGLGWGLSWLKEDPSDALSALPPLLKWRVADGYGFRDGMVAPGRHVRRIEGPGQITGYGEAIWRQGLGRSLWYTTRGDVEEIRDAVNGFASPDRPELWTGVGTAATWIGCREQGPMATLRKAAGHDAHWLALGAALGSRTARDSGAITERQMAPCQAFASSSPSDLAALTDAAEASLAEDGTTPLFQRWKDDIATRLA